MVNGSLFAPENDAREDVHADRNERNGMLFAEPGLQPNKVNTARGVPVAAPELKLVKSWRRSLWDPRRRALSIISCRR
jgi:hypothetical protein